VQTLHCCSLTCICEHTKCHLLLLYENAKEHQAQVKKAVENYEGIAYLKVKVFIAEMWLPLPATGK
jgi:hypothetical protein